ALAAARDWNGRRAGGLAPAQQKLQGRLHEVGADAPAADAPVLPLRPFRGDLEWPADGLTIRRRFDRAGIRGATSNGIEFAVAEGTPVRAIHEGVVAFADTFSGFGDSGEGAPGGARLTLVGNRARWGRKEGLAGGARKGDGGGGPAARRPSRAVLRDARRRSARRSSTMA